MARNNESWITPRLTWTNEPCIFACRVRSNCEDLLQLLAEDCITSTVLPRKQAALLAALPGGIAGACMVLASSVAADRKGAGSKRFFLHDVLRLPDGDVLVLVGLTPSILASSSRHMSRKNAAADAIREYQEKLAAERKRTEQQQANVRNQPKLGEEEKRKYLHALAVGNALRAPPPPPKLSDLADDYEEAAFVCPLPKSPHARQVSILNAVRLSARGFSRTGRYECTEIKTNHQKLAAVIRWTPRGNRTPALEVKGALERRFRTAFAKPRLISRQPPAAEPLTDTQPISLGEIREEAEDLDQVRLSDQLPQPTPEGKDLFKANGFEAIAWYLPFHRYDETVWGIYFNAPKLDVVVASLAQDLGKHSSRPHELAARLVVQLTLAHELFHSRLEFAAAWIELASRRKSYLPYTDTVYTVHSFTDDWREEALANWSAHLWLTTNLSLFQDAGLVRDGHAVVRVIENWLDFSPAGYRNWREGSLYGTWERLATELALRTPYPKSGKTVPLPIGDLLRTDQLLDLQHEDIPVYVVGRGAVADAFFSAPSRREVLRILKHYGYRLLPGRGKGSHEVWQGPDNRMFAVPLRDPLSVGVFHELLAHFGWTKKQYMDEIRALV